MWNDVHVVLDVLNDVHVFLDVKFDIKKERKAERAKSRLETELALLKLN